MFAGSTAACRGKVRSLVPLCRRLFSDMPGSPSPESPDLRPDTEKQRRPKKDPSDCSVLLFPGQGSQFVGMGRGLLKYPNVKEMFQVARKILGYDLLSLCLEGPEAELMKTVHCQPAVFITSLAAVERLHHQNPKVGVFSSLQMKRASASLLWRFKGKICLFSHLKKMKLKLFRIMHANILLYCGHRRTALENLRLVAVTIKRYPINYALPLFPSVICPGSHDLTSFFSHRPLRLVSPLLVSALENLLPSFLLVP